MTPQLNATNGNPVSITNGADFVIANSGNTGPLSISGASLGVGLSSAPLLSVAGAATFSGSSNFSASILTSSSAPVAGTNYGQLRATGDIALGGSALTINSVFFSTCGALPAGNEYTLAQTTGGRLSGTFSNAGEGAVVTEANCNSSSPRA